MPRLDRTKRDGMYDAARFKEFTVEEMKARMVSMRNIPAWLDEILLEVRDYLKNYEGTELVPDPDRPNKSMQVKVRSDTPPRFPLPPKADYRAEIASQVAVLCQ